MRCDAESKQVHWLDSRKDKKYIHILLRFIYFVCFKIPHVCKKNDSPSGSFTPQFTRCHLSISLKYAWLLLCFLFFLYISLKILSDVDSSFFQSLHFLPWLLVFGLAAAPGWLSELTDLSVALRIFRICFIWTFRLCITVTLWISVAMRDSLRRSNHFLPVLLQIGTIFAMCPRRVHL